MVFISERLPHYMFTEQHSCNASGVIGKSLANQLQGVRGYWQSSGQFVIGCQSGNPLTNSSEGIGNCANRTYSQRFANML
jgi:hypothetical protein